jgi:hypothetical protein
MMVPSLSLLRPTLPEARPCLTRAAACCDCVRAPPAHAPVQSRFQDRLIGRVVIPVADVVRNGRLQDSWALQDAESGTIEMKLEWQDCYVDDYVE